MPFANVGGFVSLLRQPVRQRPLSRRQAAVVGRAGHFLRIPVRFEAPPAPDRRRVDR